MTPMLPPPACEAWCCSSLISVGRSLICNPEAGISRIRGSPKITAFFHLERAQTSWPAPFMIGGRVHWKSSARESHPSQHDFVLNVA